MSSLTLVERVALVACGSFNPITNMHLRMFEVARDHLQATGRYKVICGILSPVHDSYGKKDLVSSDHRLEMCRLAVESSSWIETDDWEVSQPMWTCTRDVLQYYERDFNQLHRAPKCLRNTNVDDTYQKAIAGDRDQSAGVNPRTVRVMLLCGSDLLESFAQPGLWNTDHIDELTRKFGLAVIRRSGSDADRFIYEHDTVYANRKTVHVITERLYNEISSTKVRTALRRGESVRYVVQDSVISYIERNGLYKA